MSQHDPPNHQSSRGARVEVPAPMAERNDGMPPAAQESAGPRHRATPTPEEQLIGPSNVILYVCKGCSVWTVHRRKRCVWCNSMDAPEMVQYINEGAVT